MVSSVPTQWSTDAACAMETEARVCRDPETVWQKTQPAPRKRSHRELPTLSQAPWTGWSAWGMMWTGEVRLLLLKAPLKTQTRISFTGLWSSLAAAFPAVEVLQSVILYHAIAPLNLAFSIMINYRSSTIRFGGIVCWMSQIRWWFSSQWRKVWFWSEAASWNSAL